MLPEYETLPIIIFTGKSLSIQEEIRIKKYASAIVLKTAESYQRLMDEIIHFLHLVESEEDKKRKKSASFSVTKDILLNKRVLIVDDDIRNIFSLTKLLEMHTMIVSTASNGNEALEMVNNNTYDMILMDMMMPELDGYMTMESIRKNDQFLTLPIIAVTAKTMLGDRQKCIESGASDYISKPVDSDQLISLMRVWLQKK